MIIVKLWGGLGNQLFQYAFGHMMAQKHNDSLYFDISFYNKHQYSYVGHRRFELDRLNLDIQIAEKLPAGIRFLETFVVNRVIRRYKRTLKLSCGSVFFVKEAKRAYMESVPYKPGKINYYDGYWQSGRYFQEYRDVLKQMFAPAFTIPENVQSFIDTIENTENSVSIHIRKGDFKGMVGHSVDNYYYHNAIKHMQETIQNPVFFVFSDDLQWVKDNIDFGGQAYYSDYRGPDGAILDLYCMSKCRYGIMSASTFSWWGNWLKDAGGTIIAPAGQYFNDQFLDDAWMQL